MSQNVEFVSTQSRVQEGESATFNVETDVPDEGGSGIVEVTGVLFVGGVNNANRESSKTIEANEGDQNVRFSVSGTFEGPPEGQESVTTPYFVEVLLDYESQGGLGLAVDSRDSTNQREIEVFSRRVSEAEEQGEGTVITEPTDTLSSTFDDFTGFAIREIEYEQDASYISSLYDQEFENVEDTQFSIDGFDFSNPTVSIDTSGRFVKHEIIGGTTVRQKVGEDPVNISVNGVCKRTKANKIDSLRDASVGKIYSDRLPGENSSMLVQFGSAKTDPLEDGGAADFVDGKRLYTFQLNAIEVIR